VPNGGARPQQRLHAHWRIDSSRAPHTLSTREVISAKCGWLTTSWLTLGGLAKMSRRTRSEVATDKNLRELFHETLQDIHFGEKKILSTLPKMAKAA
jgi:hypothetical protein